MNCRITLKPYPKGNRIEKIQCTFVIEGCTFPGHEVLCSSVLEMVSVPNNPIYNFSLSDAQGDVKWTAEDVSQYPCELRNYLPLRQTSGTVSISYVIVPRIIDESAKCGPYFDFCNEDGGANGSGQYLLINPNIPEGNISLKWDLSQMPEGTRAVWTWGEGDIEFLGSVEKLRQSYFCLGQVNSITEGEFGFYWLAETNFDVKTLADYTRKLFDVMQNFFHDTNPVYRIFLRKDPYNHSGGTALMRSYMFGWNETEPVTLQDKQNILAHEMVHNWPTMIDEPYGSGSWYPEGTAEYYSIMIPLRAGLITKEQALHEIQRRTDDYFTNPTRNMTNLEGAKICWKERNAQRLPYGRGIFFLANCDVKIRKAAPGKSIDDVVMALLKHGEQVTNELFLETMEKISGIDVREDWKRMQSGQHFAPLDESFDGHFAVSESKIIDPATGEPAVSYRWNIIQ